MPVARSSDLWHHTIDQAFAARTAVGKASAEQAAAKKADAEKAAAETAAQQKVRLAKALVPWLNVLFFVLWTIVWWRGMRRGGLGGSSERRACESC